MLHRWKPERMEPELASGCDAAGGDQRLDRRLDCLGCLRLLIRLLCIWSCGFLRFLAFRQKENVWKEWSLYGCDCDRRKDKDEDRRNDDCSDVTTTRITTGCEGFFGICGVCVCLPGVHNINWLHRLFPVLPSLVSCCVPAATRLLSDLFPPVAVHRTRDRRSVLRGDDFTCTIARVSSHPISHQ